MGRKRINGYILEWFIGDHDPKHIHVFSAKGEFIGRLDVKKMTGIEGWIPDKKLVAAVFELLRKNKL